MRTPREIIGKPQFVPTPEFFVFFGIDPDRPISAEQIERHPVVRALGLVPLGAHYQPAFDAVAWRWAPPKCWEMGDFCQARGEDRHAAALRALLPFFELEWRRAGKPRL